MTDGSYNGFSGKQRDRAQSWLRKEWASGRLPKPSICAACGQTQGRIDAHAEDYSEPFRAGVTDQFHLCQTCHRHVHDRTKNPTAWREYRAKVEAGGRKKIGASKLGLKGDEQFDWGEPPTRRVLLEIEMSQDAGAAANSPSEDKRNQLASKDRAQLVFEAFTRKPLTPNERHVVQTLLDNPGLSSAALTQAAGWRGQVWHMSFGKLCSARGELLWQGPFEPRRNADFYCGILADYDDATSGFTMKPEAVEGFRRLGLKAKDAT